MTESQQDNSQSIRKGEGRLSLSLPKIREESALDNIILKMNNITKLFPGVKALDKVNIEVKKGEIHALCGENGAGKSTLMNVLSGI